MASNPQYDGPADAASRAHHPAALDALVAVALVQVNAQFEQFSARLADALLQLSDLCSDGKEANLCFNSANLLKNHGYAFFHLTSEQLQRALRHEMQVLEHGAQRASRPWEGDLSLVPYAEMDNKVLLGTTARLFDIENAEQLTALNIRLAYLLERDSVNVAQNPFRPEVFLDAINAAWREFDPDANSHALILPLLRPQVFLELVPIIKALNDSLVAAGVLPDSINSYRIRKSEGNLSSALIEANDAARRQQLRRVFQSDQQGTAALQGEYGGSPQIDRADGAPRRAASARLYDHLAQLQRQPIGNAGDTLSATASMQLAQIKQQLPPGSLNRVDEATIDLLTQVFDTVFQDRHIPDEIKELIGFLQVPVLRAALVDKEFFYSESHPARKLIELLTQSSMAWDQSKGLADPLYQTIKRTVVQVHQGDPEQSGSSSFAQAVSALESYIHEEETAFTTALEAPITQALHAEKILFASKSAKDDVAVRISTGEVVPFVEAFLESRWVPVLTLAHSIKTEKPEVLSNAIKTMDDLLWSVKPKVTPDTRKELISRLPAILAMLNKWLNVIKWDDIDRLQFFADLAECHASIVRAPIELSSDRQIEIAVEVAKKAAERRIEIKAQDQPAPLPDQFVTAVDSLQRGTWLQFEQPDGAPKKVRLAWVSPLRSLYIFSTSQRQEAFSISSDDLAEKFRSATVQVLQLDGIVDRALSKALGAIEQEEPVTAE